MVLVLFRITETPRATATRIAGPTKSATPRRNAPAVPASPRRATRPTTTAMTTNRAVSSGSHQPSSNQIGLVTVSWVRGSAAVLLRIAPQGMIEKVSRRKVKASRPMTSFWRADSGASAWASASSATAASSGPMPTSDLAGSAFTRLA
jgi:hypothetical protein